MIEAALFTLAVVAVALWEGVGLWHEGYRREAVVAWSLWALGLVLGNLLILLDPAPNLSPVLDRLFRPVGRLLIGS